jgi:hypothetical protein
MRIQGRQVKQPSGRLPTSYGPYTRTSETGGTYKADDEGWEDQWEQMPRTLDPFQFLLVAISGWMNQRQLQVIEYLREENRVRREQLGEHRLRFNDDQRRRLAVRAKGLGRKLPG